MDEIKQILEAQRKAFEDFKKLHAEELAAVKAGAQVDPLVKEQIEKANAEIGRLGAQLKEVENAQARKGVTGEADTKAATAAEVKRALDYLRKGATEGLARVKAASAGSDGDGGYGIPEDFDRVIGQVEKNAAPMRSICNVIRTSGEDYVKLFNLSGATATWVDETEARPVTPTPTIAKLVPVYGSIYSNAYATQKVLDDAAFDVSGWIANDVGMAWAAAEDAAFVSGNGTKQPKGILAYTLAATADSSRTFGQIEKFVSTTTASSFVANDLITLLHKLKPGYRQSARWLMATDTVAHCRKFTDATSGQYLWQPGLSGGQPASLLGFPITEDENVPAVGTSNNAVLFGDFKRAYTIADVGSSIFFRDPYTQTPYVRFYFEKRVGGFLADSNAVKVLVCKASG